MLHFSELYKKKIIHKIIIGFFGGRKLHSSRTATVIVAKKKVYFSNVLHFTAINSIGLP